MLIENKTESKLSTIIALGSLALLVIASSALESALNTGLVTL